MNDSFNKSLKSSVTAYIPSFKFNIQSIVILLGWNIDQFTTLEYRARQKHFPYFKVWQQTKVTAIKRIISLLFKKGDIDFINLMSCLSDGLYSSYTAVDDL